MTKQVLILSNLSLLDIVNNLKPLRASKSSTNAYLAEVFERFSLDKHRELANFLFESVTDDDTYCYAYNFFVLRRNCDFVFLWKSRRSLKMNC